MNSLNGPELRRALAVVLRDESGQGTVEYSTILVMMFAALFGVRPISLLFFEALQTYIDMYFYSLNLAIG